MIKLIYESNSADGIRACALAVPGGSAGKRVTVETDIPTLKLTLNECSKHYIITMSEKTYDFIIPEEVNKIPSSKEVVITAEPFKQ